MNFFLKIKYFLSPISQQKYFQLSNIKYKTWPPFTMKAELYNKYANVFKQNYFIQLCNFPVILKTVVLDQREKGKFLGVHFLNC